MVEGSFTQDRIVRPLVEAYHDAVGVYVKLATSCDKLAVELLGFRFVEPMQLGGQPPIAAIRQDGQRDMRTSDDGQRFKTACWRRSPFI